MAEVTTSSLTWNDVVEIPLTWATVVEENLTWDDFINYSGHTKNIDIRIPDLTKDIPVQIHSKNITAYKKNYTLQYDPTILKRKYFNYQNINISGSASNCVVVSEKSGEIVFRCENPKESYRSGLNTVVLFTPLRAATTTISLVY